MHIIHVRLSGGVSKGMIGGGPQHFNHLLNNLSLQDRVGITVLTNEKDESVFSKNIRKIGVKGLPNISYDPISLFLKLNFSFVKIWAELGQLTKDEKIKNCSLILSESPFLVDLLTTIYLSRKHKVPAIVYFHHLTPPPWVYPRRRGFGKATVKWLNETISLTMVKIFNLQLSLDNSRFLDLKVWNFKSEILTDEEFLEWDISYEGNKLVKKKYDACFTGRIQESKGIEDLLYLWKKVVLIHGEAKLVIMGNSTTKYGLRIIDEVHKLKLEKNIFFTGFIEEEKKKTILSSSKLFVFPSYEEGWSISVMESVKYGCVPIVYNIPAYDYLGQKATRVKLGNRDQMAKEVLSLLKKDEYSLARINYAIVNEIKKYDINRVTTLQLDFFKRLINNS